MAKKDIQGQGVKVFNAVRSTLDPATKQAVPRATEKNIGLIQKAFKDYPEVRNAFLTRLYDKVAVTIIQHNMFENPLTRFKKTTETLGTTIEEIHVNLLEAEEYDYANPAAELLKTRTPDVDATYHVRNREVRYAVTLRETQMAGAFTSWTSFESLVSYILTRLTDSNERDEFNLMKKIPVAALANNHVHQIEFGELSTVDDYNRLAITFREVSGNLTFYNTLSGSKRDTVTPKDKQVILIPNNIKAKFDVTVLAEKFNMSKAEFEAQHITVDTFDDDNIIAFIVSENFFIVYDSLIQQNSQYNPALLQMNHFLHVMQTLAYSPYANAVAIVKVKSEPTGGGDDTFTVELKQGGVTVEELTLVAGETYTYDVNAMASVGGVGTPTSFDSTDLTVSSYSEPENVTITTTDGDGFYSCGTVTFTVAAEYVKVDESIPITWTATYGATQVGPGVPTPIPLTFNPTSYQLTIPVQ